MIQRALQNLLRDQNSMISEPVLFFANRHNPLGIRQFTKNQNGKDWAKLGPKAVLQCTFYSMIFLAALFLSVVSSTLSYAEEPISFETLEDRLVHLEKNERYGKKYNPGAAYGYGWLVGADVLYWQARENGIPYAIETPNLLNPFPLPPVLKSQVKELDFDWDFGVRVFGGIQFHRDDWRILGNWTHFDTKANDHGYTSSDDTYLSIWSDPRFENLPNHVNKIKAKYKLFFNEADLMLMRPFYQGRYFILEPGVGVSGVWIDQDLHVRAKRIPFLLLPAGFSRVKLENDFKGIGLRAALDTRFCFRHGMSLFNNTQIGLYYGKFELSRKEKFLTDNLQPAEIDVPIKNHYWQVCPVIAMQMGFRWDYGFSKERHAICVKLAYEYQLFFAQNQFLRLINTSPMPQIINNQGDLSLTGGTFSVLLTF